MPCYDPDPDNNYEAGVRDSKAKIDKLTRFLCEAMRAMNRLEDPRGDIRDCSKELREWWKDHKAFDKKRGARK